MFGEYGGAVDLVWKAQVAVAAAWSRRGPRTALTELFMRLTGAASPDRLLEGLSQEEYHLGAEIAPLIFEAAEAGDAVAAECIAWAGRELGSLIVGVVRQLGFEELSFEVVQVGSMHNGGPRLLDPMAETVHAVAPGARFVRLTAPPVVGAVLLGMEQAGPGRPGPAAGVDRVDAQAVGRDVLLINQVNCYCAGSAAPQGHDVRTSAPGMMRNSGCPAKMSPSERTILPFTHSSTLYGWPSQL